MVKKSGIRLKFCKGDAVVILFVTMLAVLIGGLFVIKTGTEKGNTVVIFREGQIIEEIPLEHEGEFLIKNSYTNKLVVKEGKVGIVESDCPGMDCVHSGWISGKGRSIVCLPNRVEVRIQEETESEVDFIVR